MSYSIYKFTVSKQTARVEWFVEVRDGVITRISRDDFWWAVGKSWEEYKLYHKTPKGVLTAPDAPKKLGLLINPLKFLDHHSKFFDGACFWLNTKYDGAEFIEYPTYGGMPKKYSERLTKDEWEWIHNNLKIKDKVSV